MDNIPNPLYLQDLKVLRVKKITPGLKKENNFKNNILKHKQLLL